MSSCRFEIHPPDRIEIEDITLRRHRPEDAALLAEAANESIDHLRPWMAWAAQPASLASMAEFIASAMDSFESGTEFNYLMLDTSMEPVGGCGLRARGGPGVLEIGYWVHAKRTGRGIATRAARALTSAAFELEAVDRVEIHCDAANKASSAIPKRLGFTLTRTEHRRPETPGESGRHMIWALRRADYPTCG